MITLKVPRKTSIDQIRKEPRKGCLSRIESLSDALTVLEKRGDIKKAIIAPFGELINRSS